jgi:peptidoglycan/xylan/chitin deacetylase (PgdA/CDA1 family)
LKRSPKRLAADLLHATGALQAARLARATLLRRPALLILCYHRVAPAAAPLSPLCLSPVDFERTLAVLTRRRDVWPLQRVGEWLAGRARLRRDTLVVTFDDGYADNHEHAAPVLERMGLPATFFVSTGRLRGREGFWWDEIGARLDRCPDPRLLDGVRAGERVRALLQAYVASQPGLRRAPARALLAILKWDPEAERARLLASLREILPGPGPRAADLLMTTEQVRDLARRGFEIGGHGVTHAAFSALDPAGRREEARRSRDDLRALGLEARSFAYPYGDAGDRGAAGDRGPVERRAIAVADRDDGARAAAEAGYLLAVTTEERVAARADAPWLLPRKVIAEQSAGQVATRIERLAWRGAA